MVESGYWGKRVGASIFDFLVLFILVGAIIWVFYGLELDSLTWILLFLISMLVIGYLYFTVMEAAMGSTLGKMIIGTMEVVDVETHEPITGGQAASRNVMKVFFLLPLIDYMGRSPVNAMDIRQTGSDVRAMTLVRFVPKPAMDYRPRWEPSPEPIKEEPNDYFGIPAEMLNGQCPKCSSPYKIIPPTSEEEARKIWDGLWNSRCTWCNTNVLEWYKDSHRLQPPKWY